MHRYTRIRTYTHEHTLFEALNLKDTCTHTRTHAHTSRVKSFRVTPYPLNFPPANTSLAFQYTFTGHRESHQILDSPPEGHMPPPSPQQTDTRTHIHSHLSNDHECSPEPYLQQSHVEKQVRGCPPPSPSVPQWTSHNTQFGMDPWHTMHGRRGRGRRRRRKSGESVASCMWCQTFVRSKCYVACLHMFQLYSWQVSAQMTKEYSSMAG